MRFIVAVGVLCLLGLAGGKSTKKTIKDESAILNKKLIGKSKSLAPAIIAIEIVDPNENKTSSKNSKRTINSSLGYGYQGYTSSPPRYEVYKYSQYDIPPYRPSYNIYGGGGKTQYEIQKSISYNLPTSHSTVGQQYYQPGTTLFSTVNNQGQVGGLTSHLPQQQIGHDPQIPVIILRVYPSQLNDPTAVLHPNLPQSHPLAAAINSIDVQALLNKYVKNVLTEPKYQQEQVYQHPQLQPQQQPNPANYYHQQGYQYEQPTYQEEQNYEYVQQPQYQQTYSEQSSSLSSSSSGSSTDGLLTHENYPKDSHTRVVFRTDKNKAGHSPIPPGYTETKTIKIHLPSTYSAGEVQTPSSQYQYDDQNQPEGQGYYYEGQQDGAVMQSYYYSQPQQYEYQNQGDQQQYVQASSGLGTYGSNEAQGQVTPHNYHAHPKRTQRSKKRAPNRVKVENQVKDISRLDPIKA